MWREVDDQGVLVNSFADTVSAKFPIRLVRGLWGALPQRGVGYGVEHLDEYPRDRRNRVAVLAGKHD